MNKRIDSTLSRSGIHKKILKYNRKYFNKSRKHAINNTNAWSEEEDQLVIKHACKDADLAKQLGRSIKAIEARRHVLRQKGKTTKKYMKAHKYTKLEIKYICNSSEKLADIADTIGISLSAAANMRYKYRER